MASLSSDSSLRDQAIRWIFRQPARPLLVALTILVGAGLSGEETSRESVARALRSGADAATRAQALLSIPPARLEAALAEDGSLANPARQAFAAALGERRGLEQYVAAVDRLRIRRLSKSGWSPEGVRSLLSLLLLDPPRFLSDAAFRGRVVRVLADAWDPRGAPALRRIVLSELGSSGACSFDEFERIQRKWNAVSRTSEMRRVRFAPAAWNFSSDASGRIDTSIYSLPSAFFERASAERFLSAVRAANPRRKILVFSDLPIAGDLAAAANRLGIRLLDTFAWGLTPWTRDTFSLLRGTGGRVLALERPAGPLQSGREHDSEMARELIKDLPDSLDREWGQAVWSKAPVPFHNGQVLLTETEAWITLHTLEPRILEILGAARVPVASFSKAEGVDAYLRAAHRAAGELETLYRRKVRFTHALPESGAPEQRNAAMTRIGGGAGFDLDSYLTLLPSGRPAKLRALVADLRIGSRLLRDASSADWDTLRKGYGLTPGPDLATRLGAYQATPRPASFADFLDLVAAGLEHQGIAVSRVPVVFVPVSLLEEREGLEGEADFMLTWNNVVVEEVGSRLRAEGFSGLFPPGDRAATAAFTGAGCELELFPPLVRSVVLNGGYRCASNHLRVKR